MKLTNKMIKRNNHLPYQVDIYMIYRKINEDKNASKVFKNIQENLKKQSTQIVNVSNTFIRYALYQEALDLYLYVEDFSESNSKYSIQKAQLYQYLSQDEKMINEYLEYLIRNPYRKITVVNYLQRYLDNNGIENDKNYNYVKNGLLRFSQKEKDTYVFSELLIWLFMQNNEFTSLSPAKALDKRLNEDGERLYDLQRHF